MEQPFPTDDLRPRSEDDETRLRDDGFRWGKKGTHASRTIMVPTALTTAYALWLGYLAGLRGMALFNSLWARVLDAPVSELVKLAVDARRLGDCEPATRTGPAIWRRCVIESAVCADNFSWDLPG